MLKIKNKLTFVNYLEKHTKTSVSWIHDLLTETEKGFWGQRACHPKV